MDVSRSRHTGTFFKNETFDWFAFNGSIISEHLSGQRKAIAIDPSYIPKSSNKPPWIGRFRNDATLYYPALESRKPLRLG